MTRAELLDTLKDAPDDAEVVIYSEAAHRWGRVTACEVARKYDSTTFEVSHWIYLV